MQTEAPATPDQEAGPTPRADRLVSLDALRGVAVLGILLMNIYAFAMPFLAYLNPLAAGGTEWYNLGTWFATHVIADQKFMTIFSLLFGGGLILMWERAAARGVPFRPIHYRRQFWLLVIGAIHAYLIWFGDILFFYALMGMLIYPLRRLAPRRLIIIACLLLPVGLLSNYGGFHYMTDLESRADEITELAESGADLSAEQQQTLDEWEEARAFFAPTGEDLEREREAYRGSYLDALAYRVPLVAGLHVQNTVGFVVWRVGGLMILGMALMKLGILTGARDREPGTAGSIGACCSPVTGSACRWRYTAPGTCTRTNSRCCTFSKSAQRPTTSRALPSPSATSPRSC